VHPSQKWLQQLPHKARKLEELLYSTASSVEAYIDRTTLKVRLQKLAAQIAQQHQQSKRKQPEETSEVQKPARRRRSVNPYSPSGTSAPASDTSMNEPDDIHSSLLGFLPVDTSIAETRSGVSSRTLKTRAFASKPSPEDAPSINGHTDAHAKLYDDPSQFEGQISQSEASPYSTSYGQFSPRRNSIQPAGTASSSSASNLKEMMRTQLLLQQQQLVSNIQQQEEMIRKLQQSQFQPPLSSHTHASVLPGNPLLQPMSPSAFQQQQQLLLLQQQQRRMSLPAILPHPMFHDVHSGRPFSLQPLELVVSGNAAHQHSPPNQPSSLSSRTVAADAVQNKKEQPDQLQALPAVLPQPRTDTSPMPTSSTVSSQSNGATTATVTTMDATAGLRSSGTNTPNEDKGTSTDTVVDKTSGEADTNGNRGDKDDLSSDSFCW
jgi:hypothetical protein